jgi:hypothetical protein
MQHRKLINVVVKTTLYIYLFTIVPALIARAISFGMKTIEALFLVPLMVFSISYGLLKLKEIVNPQSK